MNAPSDTYRPAKSGRHAAASPCGERAFVVGAGAVLASLAILKHTLLQSTAADLGIFEQYCWLISRGLPTFSTLSGATAFADHKAFVLYPLAWLYGTVSSAWALLVIQAAALATAGAVVRSLSRQLGHDAGMQRLAMAVWFLFPTTLALDLCNFHPDALAVPALLGMVLYAGDRKWSPYFGCLVFALGCKDTIAFSVMGVGAWMVLTKRRLTGFVTIGLALGWFCITQWLERGSAVYLGFVARYAYLGDTPGHILAHVVREPWILFQHASADGWLLYPMALLLPVLPWLRRRSFLPMLPALPHFLLNLLSRAPQQQDVTYQYTACIAPFVVLGALYGMPNSVTALRYPILRCVFVVGAFVWLSRVGYFLGRYLDRLSLRAPAAEAFRQIGPSDRVLAASYLASHVAGRRVIEVPNRFVVGHLERFDVLLVSESDPGDDSAPGAASLYVEEAERLRWSCRTFDGGKLVFCRKRDDEGAT